MDTEGMSSPQAAEWFLKEHPEVWSSWVDEEVRAKVSKALGL